MSPPTNPVPSLRAMELEVQAEGREWMRRRLEQKLQVQADRQGGGFPPKRTQGASSATGADAPAQRLRRGGAESVARKKSR